MKTHTRYVCQTCGAATPRWLGKCNECGEWNTLVEEVVERAAPAAAARHGAPRGDAPAPISAVAAEGMERLSSGVGELDRVLGGGIVDGSVVLIGGDPGIGKSTLLTQVAALVASDPGAPGTVLYVSGEESARQVRLRCERLGPLPERFLVVCETDLRAIMEHIAAAGASLVIIDSIQTTVDASLESAPGTVTQVRQCAGALTRAAKGGGPPVFIIGHVTKEGSLAGPRVLEHMVDSVLYFEGDRHHAYRILRAVKNRFGSTDEIGIFEMREDGLQPVENASAALLAEREAGASGSSVTALLEGSRPLLIEAQALVSRSFLAAPRRSSNGVDINRANMLLAVLEKRVGLRLGDQDVFINVAGGVRLNEPSADLAVVLAVASSFRDQPVDAGTVLIGEVGLGGEIRSVPRLDKRVREAARMGFSRVVTARHGVGALPKVEGIKVSPAATVSEAIALALTPASRGSASS